MNTPEGPLATLLALEARARRARDVAELAFVAVNETHDLLPYRQAALWRPSGLVAVSGVARPESRAPFTEWIERLMRAHAAADPTTLDGATLGDPDWAEWLPRHALLLPFASGAAALFAREEAFSPSEIALAEALADVWGHALVSLEARSRPRLRLPRRPALIALLLAAAGFLPVPLTVLAPASVVAKDAIVMRAPLDGVVERVHVQPNDAVAPGQPLFDLDPTELAARLAVAEKAAASAEAERHQAAQQSFLDPKAKGRLAVLDARLEERRAETDHLRALLARIRVAAPAAGVAVFEDASEWLGRPVRIGERVMLLADPARTEIEAWLPIAEAIEIGPGTRLVLHLNIDPLAPVEAVVRRAAYEAEARPDGSHAHRIRADLAPGAAPPRLGLAGTAKLYGPTVPLWYWVLRRPLATIRQGVGW